MVLRERVYQMLASVLYRRTTCRGTRDLIVAICWMNGWTTWVRRSADTARREFVMPFLDGDVVVQQVDAKYWLVHEPITYVGNTEQFVVPKKFKTDFASVPRAFVWLLPRYGNYTRSAILHDFLARDKSVSPADADGIFRRSMRELGVPFARRWIMWAAVRAASSLRGADARELGQFAIVAPAAIAYVAIPGAVVQLFLVLFWLVELLFWFIRRILRRQEPRPKVPVKAA